ncbi:MAG TPA: hypothetical protein GX518_05085 [Firmicutes bacterium]|nr:hypothetical protein [Bacillota bacterium]
MAAEKIPWVKAGVGAGHDLSYPGRVPHLFVEGVFTMTCPVCGGREVGKVGARQYYCHDCCVEFVVRRDRIQVYQVEDDGTLVAVAEVKALG